MQHKYFSCTPMDTVDFAGLVITYLRSAGQVPILTSHKWCSIGDIVKKDSGKIAEILLNHFISPTFSILCLLSFTQMPPPPNIQKLS